MTKICCTSHNEKCTLLFEENICNYFELNAFSSLSFCFLFGSRTLRSPFANEKKLLQSSVLLHCGMQAHTKRYAHTRPKEGEGETLPYLSYNEIPDVIIVPETENLLGSLTKESVTVSWSRISDHNN